VSVAGLVRDVYFAGCVPVRLAVYLRPVEALVLLVVVLQVVGHDGVYSLRARIKLTLPQKGQNAVRDADGR